MHRTALTAVPKKARKIGLYFSRLFFEFENGDAIGNINSPFLTIEGGPTLGVND
jgi:hypothetical protein